MSQHFHSPDQAYQKIVCWNTLHRARRHTNKGANVVDKNKNDYPLKKAGDEDIGVEEKM